MRLLKLFEEKTGQKNKAYNDLIELLKKSYSANLKCLANGTSVPLFRGTNQESTRVNYDLSYFFSPARTVGRRSATGFNLFLDFVKNSNKWKSLPNRAMSVCCTPSLGMAKNFSNKIFLIIPADGVELAVSPGDFNEIPISSTNESLLDIAGEISGFINKVVNDLRHEDLGEELNTLLKDKIFDKDVSEDYFSLSEIKHLSDAIELIIEKAENTSSSWGPSLVYLKSTIEVFRMSLDNKSLLDFLNTSVTPNSMGITGVKSYSNLHHTGDVAEIWFYGDCIGIKVPIDMFDAQQLLDSQWFKQIVTDVETKV